MHRLNLILLILAIAWFLEASAVSYMLYIRTAQF